MTFHFISNDKLPLLSWIAHINKGEEIVKVTHGSWVEINSTYFVEGAWDDRFSEGNFDQATSFFGSGAKITTDGVLFATPTHGLDRLYLLNYPDEVLISNSLAFILAVTNNGFDNTYRFYRYDILELLSHGTKRPCKSIPTKNRRRIKLYHFCKKPVSTPFVMTCVNYI